MIILLSFPIYRYRVNVQCHPKTSTVLYGPWIPIQTSEHIPNKRT